MVIEWNLGRYNIIVHQILELLLKRMGMEENMGKYRKISGKCLQKTMENHHAINGKTHSVYGHFE